MKQSTARNIVFAFLTVFMLGSITGCNYMDDQSSSSNAPILQSDLKPPGERPDDPDKVDCRCITPGGWNFTTSHVITPPENSNFDFGIGVMGETDCDMNHVVGSKCRLDGKKYFLSFNEEYQCPLSLSDFSSIEVFTENGNLLPFELDVPNNGIYVPLEYPGCTVNFKWDSGTACPQQAVHQAFRTGGICIIGIVTDPTGGSNGGSGGGGGGSTGSTGSNG